MDSHSREQPLSPEAFMRETYSEETLRMLSRIIRLNLMAQADGERPAFTALTLGIDDDSQLPLLASWLASVGLDVQPLELDDFGRHPLSYLVPTYDAPLTGEVGRLNDDDFFPRSQFPDGKPPRLLLTGSTAFLLSGIDEEAAATGYDASTESDAFRALNVQRDILANTYRCFWIVVFKDRRARTKFALNAPDFKHWFATDLYTKRQEVEVE